MNRAVITIPLSPRKYKELGRFTVPAIGDAIANIVGANFYLVLNHLDSYHDRKDDLKKYLETYHNLDMKGEIWIDEEHKQALFAIFEDCIKKGFVEERIVRSYSCPCGVIDIEESKVATLNPEKRQFMLKEDGMYCPVCHEKCILKEEQALVLNYAKIKNKEQRFIPEFLNKDAKTFSKMFKDSYQVITRKRNTGLPFKYHFQDYNIDIDFLWSLYLLLFQEEEKIVICGNRELYQLYLVGLMEKMIKPTAQTLLIGTPFLTGLNVLSSVASNEEEQLNKKLGILLNIKWMRKEKEYEDSIFKYLEKLSLEKKRRMLYNLKEERTEKRGLEEDVVFALRRFNMQEQVRQLKRGLND